MRNFKLKCSVFILSSQRVSIRIILKLGTWKTTFSFIHCDIWIFCSTPIRCMNSQAKCNLSLFVEIKDVPCLSFYLRIIYMTVESTIKANSNELQLKHPRMLSCILYTLSTTHLWNMQIMLSFFNVILNLLNAEF